MIDRAVSCYFEDVVVGDTLQSAARTITEDDIRRFCELTGDFHPLHTDAGYARSQGFNGIIAHGLLGLSLMEGLKTATGIYETSSVASLGWDAVRFRLPVLAGDRVHVVFAAIEKRLTSKPGRGVITEHVSLLNQRDEVVIDARHAALVLCRAAAPDCPPFSPSP